MTDGNTWRGDEEEAELLASAFCQDFTEGNEIPSSPYHLDTIRRAREHEREIQDECNMPAEATLALIAKLREAEARAREHERAGCEREALAIWDSLARERARAERAEAVVKAAIARAQCWDHADASCEEWCKNCQEEARTRTVLDLAIRAYEEADHD